MDEACLVLKIHSKDCDASRACRLLIYNNLIQTKFKLTFIRDSNCAENKSVYFLAALSRDSNPFSEAESASVEIESRTLCGHANAQSQNRFFLRDLSFGLF